MTISFSGLASGLDTSSWVESLVSLKQAKVTELEDEKDLVTTTKEAVANIKSFFTSFRSVLEKVTDTKFNVSTMDIFAQNLATSSNVDILSAIATAEAKEATYEINVDKLATSTQAASGYKFTTQIVTTTAATLDSKLANLGVKSGNIGVTVNGLEQNLYIADNDTIQTFIDKLNNLGVSASFNQDSGVFNMNIGINDINDKDNTGIIAALHLEGVNEGYQSDKLEITKTDTTFESADESTLLTDLGVKRGTLTIEANDAIYNVEIDNDTTLGEFLQALRDENINASLTEGGVFRLEDAVITNDGTTNLIDAFGLQQSVSSNIQQSGDLSYKTVVTDVTVATLDSLLNDITENGVSNGDTVVVKNSNNETSTIRLSSTSTLGDLFDGLKAAGMMAALNNDGTITISGGEITGGSFDAVREFGLVTTPTSSTVTGNVLQKTVTTTQLATEDTRLVKDLGVKAGALEVTTGDGTVHSITIDSGMTIGDLIDTYESLGISASINSSGVLTVAGGSFSAVSGGTDLLTKLYGTDMVDNTTQNSAYSKSEALKYEITETVKATLDTKLGSMGLESDSAVSFSVKDVGTVSVTLSSSMTIQDMIDKLSSKGVSASFDSESAKLTISNAELTSAKSPVSEIFGFTSIITGRYTSSKAVYGVQQEEVYANENTTLGQLGLSGSSTLKHQVKLSVDGVVYNTYVTSATKMSQVIEWINSNGATATLTNGIFRIEGGAIIEGPLEVLLGLSTQTTIVQSTTEQTAGLSTTLAAVANTNDFKITFKDSATGAASTVYTFASDATFADLISVFVSNDIDVTLTDGVLSFDTSAGTYATGALLDDFGVKSSAGIVGLAQSSINLQEIKRLTTNASSYTTFEDLGIDPTNMTICIEGNHQQCTINTLTENSTLANFFNRLSSWGVGLTGSISNGVITIKSTQGDKLTGTLAEALGINWGSTTKWNSTSNVTYKKVVYTSTGGNGSLEIIKPGNNNTGSTSSGLGSSVSTGGGTGGGTFQGTTVTCTATLDTTLSELGITSDQVITYSMAPSGGITYQPARITIKSTDTLRTLKSKIASYASMTISSTGRVSIVENSSDGNLTLTSSIISALKLAETETYDTTASVTLSPISTTSTVGAKLTTQLRAIKATALDLNPTYSITIGNVETGSLTTYTFASTDTIDDFVTTLQEAGVDATFDASTATVKIAAGGDGYITSMSSQLSYIFLFRTGEGDSYEYSDDGMSASGTLKESSNNSTTVPTSQSSVRPLMVTIEVQSTVTTDTKLSDLEDFNGTNLGITSGQVYVYTNGVRNTLNISSAETIGSLSSKLAAYGISVDMSNNQLYFNGNSNSYLTVNGLPVASASNILTKLGIQTWNTNYDTVSGSLVAEASSNGTANGDVKLVDLRGSNGNLLGITTGTYYIYDNGTKITATITSDMTVTDFLNTLNAHGISAGISSDGSITLSGKNNSYIASSGGSNIVDTLFPDCRYIIP